jgi:hypothetical protein
MNPSFEQALIDDWRQALVENADVVLLGAERYPVRRLRSVLCEKWILCSREKRSAGLSRTRRRNRDGLKWHGLARR